eukprot:scaffold6711_cov118-Isochrysis_galbana.AAC.26
MPFFSRWRRSGRNSLTAWSRSRALRGCLPCLRWMASRRSITDPISTLTVSRRPACSTTLDAMAAKSGSISTETIFAPGGSSRPMRTAV